MKAMGVCIAVAATGLGAAIGTHAASQHSARQESVERECIVPVAVAPGYLHRAILVVVNRGSRPMRVRLEGRAGSALPAAELGDVAANAERSFVHALPAGRNKLTAVTADGVAHTRQFDVVNRGAETCARRYVWTIE